MPVALTYPGVYIEEIPSGVRTIVGVSTSVTAFVGYTPRGPLDEPVRIFNYGDFERHFGGLHRNSLVSYAVRQFFLNGGSDAYVVRVAKGAMAAKVTLTDSTDTEVMDVEALSAGEIGNWLRLEIDYDTINPDSFLNLRVSRYELRGDETVQAESEKYFNLSMNEYSSTYAPSVVNSASKLVQLSLRDGLSINENKRGYSLSSNLQEFDFSRLTDTDLKLTLILDSDTSKQYMLILAGDLPTDIDGLVDAFDAAVSNSPDLAGKLLAEPANAKGAHDADGTYIRLRSASNELSSAVRVLKAPVNGLAAKLKLGLESGGREKEGASFRRPAPTGTLSTDLADKIGTKLDSNLNLDFSIQDHSQPSAPTVASGTIEIPKDTEIGAPLRRLLEEEINNIDHPAAKTTTVGLWGTFMNVRSGGDESNLTISLTHEDILGFPDIQNCLQNVRQYSLGVGATVGAQTDATPGSDGSPPDATTLEGDYHDKTGISALRDVDLFNLLVIPEATWGLKDSSDSAKKAVLQEAAVLCEEERAFLLIDPPPALASPGSNQSFDQVTAGIKNWMAGNSKNAAIYFPCIRAADPLDQYRLRDMPASGAIAGVIARTDSERGVWKAPAGTEVVVRGAQALGYTLTDPENGLMNKKGINCLRTFPVYGTVVWGGRTLQGSDQQQSEWKYIPVRRLALYIEESLYRGTQWVVFEPNDEPLWAQIRLNIGAFMQNLFRQGAFQGKTPREAYFVKCDKETTTQNDINLGIVNILVGFAPLKPAEFVIIKIQQIAGQVQA